MIEETNKPSYSDLIEELKTLLKSKDYLFNRTK